MKIKAITVVVLLSFAAAAHAQVGMGTELFQRGKSRASATAGYASNFGNDYFVLGVGVGYFLARGLEIGLDGEAWWGEDPNIYKVSPQIRYVILNHPNIKPYVGVFYRRSYYEGFDDLDSGGGRAGVYSRLGRNTFGGVGIVYEKYADCDERIYDSCDTTYPEFSVSVGF